MEEIYKIQKAYTIPDTEMREALKKDNKDYVLPQYRDFLGRYKHTNFTKNPDKYIKYSPADVATFIDQFFDASS